MGPLGVENRTSISNEQMDEWQKDGLIEYLGETDNVVNYIESACCVVLPSYREGTSKVLLEAAAMGRPLIATDVPGCREVIKDGVTGFLCRSGDYLDLSNKIELMLKLHMNLEKLWGLKAERRLRMNLIKILYAIFILMQLKIKITKYQNELNVLVVQ